MIFLKTIVDMIQRFRHHLTDCKYRLARQELISGGVPPETNSLAQG